MQSCFFCWRH